MATKTLNLKPMRGKVVVKPLPSEEVTKGGVVLPDTAQEKPVQGEIMAVGSEMVLENGQKLPMEVKVGDKVLYGKYSGTEFKLEGEEYLILGEKDILAVLL